MFALFSKKSKHPNRLASLRRHLNHMVESRDFRLLSKVIVSHTLPLCRELFSTS